MWVLRWFYRSGQRVGSQRHCSSPLATFHSKQLTPAQTTHTTHYTQQGAEKICLEETTEAIICEFYTLAVSRLAVKQSEDFFQSDCQFSKNGQRPRKRTQCECRIPGWEEGAPWGPQVHCGQGGDLPPPPQGVLQHQQAQQHVRVLKRWDYFQ